MGMAEILQKVSRNEKSICPKCFHFDVCCAIENQPCFECNQFVEVVRCKDCKRRHTEDCLMQYTDYSEDMDANPEGISVEWCEDNDFCSYGERKDNCEIAEIVENCEDCGFCDKT